MAEHEDVTARRRLLAARARPIASGGLSGEVRTATLGPAIRASASGRGRPCAETTVASSQGSPSRAKASATDDGAGWTTSRRRPKRSLRAPTMPKKPGSPEARTHTRWPSSARRRWCRKGRVADPAVRSARPSPWRSSAVRASCRCRADHHRGGAECDPGVLAERLAHQSHHADRMCFARVGEPGPFSGGSFTGGAEGVGVRGRVHVASLRVGDGSERRPDQDEHGRRLAELRQ